MYFPIIDVLKENFIAKIPSIVTQWLTDNVDPVGSAVLVDESLSISGAAADAKITGDEISDLKSDLNYKIDKPTIATSLTGTEESGKFLNSAGVISTNDSTTFKIKKFTGITEGKKYKITANSMWSASFYSFFDSSDNVISHYGPPQSQGGTALFFDDYVFAPQGASYLVVNYNTTYSIGTATEISPTDADIEEIETSIYDINSMLDGNFTPIWDTISGTTETGKYISGNGTVANIDNSSWVVLTVPVNGRGKYKITASTGYGNKYYAFYDEDGNCVKTSSGTSGAVTTITDEESVAPLNAVTLKVGASSGQTPMVKGITGYKANAKWTGKKWCCVGDSLTEANSRTTKHYYDYVSESTGIGVVVKGVGGTGYARGQDSNSAFYQRIQTVPTDADVITIFGSFNDIGAGLELGTSADTGTTTLGGCINTTIDNLYSIIPLAKVGIVSPSPWVGSNPTNEPNGASRYCALLEEICKKRSIPFLDLFHCSNLRPWDATFRELAYSKDEGNGVHPDETGHEIIASKFSAFLDMLLL